MLQRAASIVIGGKENWIWVKGYGPPTGASRERQSFWTKEEGKLRGKLFHREERPALERDTIDTSEGAPANYRYVIGQHWGITVYERTRPTCKIRHVI
jgi:hypothetical protein